MIFDQILNGTPIFFSKIEDLWTGEFFLAMFIYTERQLQKEP